MLAKKNLFVLATAAFLLLSINLIAFADTIKLKDGSVIKGTITNFKDQQFTVLLGDASRGSRRSQLTLYMEDVESIDFDGNTSPAVSVIRRDNVSTNRPENNRVESNRTDVVNRDNNQVSGNNGDNNDLTATTTQTSTPTTTQTTNPRVTTVDNTRRPTTSSILNGSNNSNTTPPVTTQPVNAPRQNTSPVSSNTSNNGNKFFTLNTKVLADSTSNGWTNSGLVVRKGQRIRISSTGRASLGKGNFATPAGIGSIADKDRLMPTEPTGALIAVIGDDNNDFIYVGSGQEFVAKRDGTLFLGINESNLDDNSGAFDAVIEAEATGETASNR
ncbi:MAG: hypothetical protein H7Z37_13320 [Pyrinomonadaceae bacterium]|nr:hypothetical protein [Pyrinomonadaceae bacterium]